MAEQPTGTVTMLFSDIEGSTRLLERLGTDRYAQALARHRELMRAAFDRHSGYEVDSEGDAFSVAFAAARAALAAAAEAQAALAAERWPEQGAIRVRMGIHSGEPMPAPPKYVGMDVHRAARIMAAGHGGQVLVSETTAALFEPSDKLSLVDLGEHRLKDLGAGVRLYQLAGDALESTFPALKTLGGRPNNLPVQPHALPRTGARGGRAPSAARRARLVTLTGPGGIGKTRLALQTAERLADYFEQTGALLDHAEALSNLGVIAVFEGENERAVALYERALDVATLAESDWATTMFTANLAEAMLAGGAHEDAVVLARRAAEIARTLDFDYLLDFALYIESLAKLIGGDVEHAVSPCRAGAPDGARLRRQARCPVGTRGARCRRYPLRRAPPRRATGRRRGGATDVLSSQRKPLERRLHAETVSALEAALAPGELRSERDAGAALVDAAGRLGNASVVGIAPA